MIGLVIFQIHSAHEERIKGKKKTDKNIPKYSPNSALCQQTHGFFFIIERFSNGKTFVNRA